MAIPFILIPIGGFILNEYYQNKKIKEVQERIESIKHTHEKNLERFNLERENTIKSLDSLERKRLEIFGSFKIFSELVETVVGRPQLTKKINNVNLKLDNLKLEELKIVSFKSIELLDKINSVGTMSGLFWGEKALLSLSGLGIGALGVSTLGIGAIISTNIKTIKRYSDAKKADASYEKMKESEKIIIKCCNYFAILEKVVKDFKYCINKINDVYIIHFDQLKNIIHNKKNFDDFTAEEKLIFENTVLLVQLLLNILKVKFFLEKKNEEGLQEINVLDINESITTSDDILKDIKY